MVAAEALSGLTRIRPRGWLASPLPAAPAAVADLLHLARDTHSGHPGAVGPLRLIAARATAAVASLCTPPHAVLKVHSDAGAYNAEIVAFALVGNSPVLPASAGHGRCLSVAADRVHPAPLRLEHPGPPRRIGHRGLRGLPARPPRRHTRTAVCIDAHGARRVPVGHLDLKPEHVRRSDDGRSRAYYERKRAEGKGHKQAVLSLARRRANVLWAMIRDGACYQPAPPVTMTA